MLALFWGVLRHFGYFQMYINDNFDNYWSIGVFVNKSWKIKFKRKLKLHMIGGNFLAVKNRDLEHGLKNKYVYEVPEVNFLL